MSPNSTSPRRFLLQFSLRGMLLLMVLIGAGLAIYRWPWTEERFLGRGQTIREVSSYHRGWNGKPVKHGVETLDAVPGDGRIEKHLYVEGELRREERFENGKLWWIQNYQSGKLDGPSWIKMDLTTAKHERMDCTEVRGTYQQGKKVGE